MKLLAVETATEACSVALYLDGQITEKFQIAPRQHTRLILPMIDQLMKDTQVTLQQLDALAFGCGPGSFTGVRVATGVVHGLAFGADLPVVPVSTLAAMAQECLDKTSAEIIFAGMDARLEEIYWGVYQRDQQGIVKLLEQETVGPAHEVIHHDQQGFGIGSAWRVYAQALTEKLQANLQGYDEHYLPRASLVAKLAVIGYENNQAVSVSQAMPVYLRDKVAKKESER